MLSRHAKGLSPLAPSLPAPARIGHGIVFMVTQAPQTVVTARSFPNPSLLFLLVNSACKVGNKLRWKEVLDPAPRSGSWVGQAEAPQVGRGTAARRAAHRLKNEMSSFAGIKRKLAKQAQDETNMLGHTKEGARVGTGQGQNKHGKTPITGLSGTHARRGRSEPDRAPWVGQRRRLRRLCY